MDRDRLEEFVEMARGPVVVEVYDSRTGEKIDEYVVRSGRIEGGWASFDDLGVRDHGEFWQEPNGPLETITCPRHG